MNKRTNMLTAGAVVLAITPIIVIFFMVLASKKESVVLFENFSSKISIPIIGFYSLLCLAVISLGIYWLIKQIVSIIKLKNEKMKAELMLLKSQVSPHFFFNTLNNLYGLVVKDAQKAQELILKLSDMMRYSIYEGEKEKVQIQEEIEFLENYIELHKMRYHKLINVDFHYNIDENRTVTPLLFIILLENAFKHGVENLIENAYIKMNLITSQKEICFVIENSFEKRDRESGIGLKNLKRRLELIYPDQHELTFSVNENIYKVTLVLKQL
ncbi:sensor histidine kinase [Sphingobacterium sp. BIGb0116]|uniref:sensor histidine kinase n=1 Tax=Sphingobacterium sp. BIGb0116 TaxID=2940619 RepID=UPI00216A53B2|nr:sensor histidine kinase [Sphingobacterium sp. BIGb0116]MCS4164813.1 LytS/YehU family sensor histidine kinase [Sphingobacterium sp. BIGb0116]